MGQVALVGLALAVVGCGGGGPPMGGHSIVIDIPESHYGPATPTGPVVSLSDLRDASGTLSYSRLSVLADINTFAGCDFVVERDKAAPFAVGDYALVASSSATPPTADGAAFAMQTIGLRVSSAKYTCEPNTCVGVHLAITRLDPTVIEGTLSGTLLEVELMKMAQVSCAFSLAWTNYTP
jgi:hypothetical protein